MSPQDIEKLLGGYATDTLTEEERRTLFEAALQNQTLFDALADEQALRELLDDAPNRAHLLATLREERRSPFARVLAWLRQPSALALAAAVAAGIVTIAVVIPHSRHTAAPATVAMQTPAPQPAAPMQMQEEKDKAAEPKPAAAAPVGSPVRSAPAPVRAFEPPSVLQRDAVPAGRIAAARPGVPALPAAPAEAPAAEPAPPVVAPAVLAPPPPPPPPQQPAATAPSRFRAPDEERVQAQPQAQPKVAAAGASGGANVGGAAGASKDGLKKETAPTTSARSLYYAAQNLVGGNLTDSNKPAAKAKQGAFGRNLSIQSAAARPAAVIGGVRWSLLRRNPDGSFAEVDPSTIFVPGDSLRIRFETNQAGNLAVMERQADGAWTLRLAARTVAGQPVYMPSESTIDVKAAGTLRFFVRFSRSLRNDARLDNLTVTPNLLRESASNSVYVVNPVAAPDPAVDFELAINARQ